ncbi:MAG TPA: hypothetical protein VJ692_07665, partial [Nitrospiraceae bacterium]|nr:hypothetical protein [Nitrospiraceae bacterium]
LAHATGVTFSHTGLSATIRTGVTETSLPLMLLVGATVPPGTYTFTVSTPLGTANSGTVTIGVAMATPSMSHIPGLVSVFMPAPRVPATSAPSGSTMGLAPPLSGTLPPPNGPVGLTTTVAPSTSEAMPVPTSPTGSSLSVAPPVSEAMPVPGTPSGSSVTVAPPVSESMP